VGPGRRVHRLRRLSRVDAGPDLAEPHVPDDRANYGTNVLEYFDQYQAAPVSSPLYQNGMRFYQAGQFEYDAVHDRLPTVSWILPTSYQSEHPDYMPAAGADYVASKVNAAAANPDVWAKTVFVLVYDENDGFVDFTDRRESQMASDLR
jgi:phospholipase C